MAPGTGADDGSSKSMETEERRQRTDEGRGRQKNTNAVSRGGPSSCWAARAQTLSRSRPSWSRALHLGYQATVSAASSKSRLAPKPGYGESHSRLVRGGRGRSLNPA